MTQSEAQDWIECPACGNRDALVEFHSQVVLFDCPSCDMETVVDVPMEPVSI